MVNAPLPLPVAGLTYNFANPEYAEKFVVEENCVRAKAPPTVSASTALVVPTAREPANDETAVLVEIILPRMARPWSVVDAREVLDVEVSDPMVLTNAILLALNILVLVALVIVAVFA